jgi:hypothetical protein
VTLKSLVTGVAAAAVVGGAAAGVTSIASPIISAGPAVTPVVWDTPMPEQGGPSEVQSQLLATLNGLAGGGSFRGAKEAYIEGGIGRIEGVTADRAYSNAAAKGLFPLSFTVVPVPDGPTATTNVTATAANGASATQLVTFVRNRISPTGWQISKGSAMALLSSVG